MSLLPGLEDAPAHRVLARKYRPQDFAALIGQDAVATTLANAIRRNRLAQAWLLTGVRGVGKTSTARIIAKALNCIGPDGSGGPTTEPCGVCANCTAIAAGQHIDVTEMDAASHTGVDDVRDIIESVRYATVQARFRIFVIDEVHMLSKNAFNALLKTLEEPPAHVKFIFATTEADKLPATILSRCQRFDLKRVPAEQLARHFASIAAAEGVSAEPEALAIIARAAEGSVRDGLSILDQAIALGDGAVTADSVRAMLGLADRALAVRLMGELLAGDTRALLGSLAAARAAGVEPDQLIGALLDLVHAATRARLADAADPAAPPVEQEAVARWAAALDFPALHRLWQLLLKGHAEVRAAPDPAQAADMALLRVAHAAELPDPGQLARLLETGAVAAAAAPAAALPASSAAAPADFAALVQLVEAAREPLIAKVLRHDVAVDAYAPGRLRLAAGRLPAGFASDLAAVLERITGAQWTVETVAAEGRLATLEAADAERADAHRRAALDDPGVRRLLDAFPEARLIDSMPARSITP